MKKINTPFTETALTILQKRYLHRDFNTKELLETPNDMFRRVSKNIASIEKDNEEWEEKFYELIANLDFLPNSPALRNCGLNSAAVGVACFVLPIDDSLESIFKTLKDAAIVNSRGGGTGYDFSNLRPINDLIRTTKGVTCGAVGFMEIFDFAVGEKIAQSGFRKSAQMGILRCDHPEIELFVSAKSEEGKLQHFNISVAVTDDFMSKVLDGKDFNWDLKFNNKIYKTINGIDLWNKIIYGAWNNGEPGIIFIDTINKLNPARELEAIKATNPCGESPLGDYQSCCLGSINLSNHINDKNKIDYLKLEETVNRSVRFLDNIIDVSDAPVPEINIETRKFRKIGLGIMGWADALIKMKIKYGSEESIKLASALMKFISNKANEYSKLLAEEKGKYPLADNINDNRRNVVTTIIAPTGSLSLIAGCSSGIEPIFSFKYNKKCIEGELDIFHPLVKEYIEKNNCSFDDLPDYFVESKDINIEDHVKMQAAFQKYVEGAVSKTINAPNSATITSVDDAFKLAYKLNCKGITFYRQGSREIEAQTSTTKDVIEATKSLLDIKKIEWVERPTMLPGVTHKVRTGDGTVYLTLNHFLSDEQVKQIKKILSKAPIIEVFAAVGKSGRSMQAMAEWATRGYSLALQKGATVKEIEKQSRGIFGENVSWSSGSMIRSIPDAFSKVLKSEYPFYFEDHIEKNNKRIYDNKIVPEKLCPDCGSTLEVAEGCKGGKCKFCGYSKC